MSWLYITLKYMHILLAIVAFGFNITYAVWIARGQRNPEHLDFALRGVKFLDDYIANPAYLLLLASGVGMVFIAGYSFTTFWIAAALVLFVIIVGVGLGLYTPTLSKQIRTLAESGPKSDDYQKIAMRSNIVGGILAVLVLAILVMMVFKPTF